MSSKLTAKYAAVTLSVMLAFSLVGCNKEQQQAARPAQEVTVVVTQLSSPMMTTELNGRTSAYQIAEVRPQVAGIIQKRTFEEGQMVKAGDQLYQIDPAIYRAAYEEASANYRLALTDANRIAKLLKLKAVSQQQYDQAQAKLKTARAALTTAKTNLDYTRVESPITGKVGRSEVTPGGLVSAYQAQYLTTVQQMDPIYVDVRQTGEAFLKLKRDIANGTIKTANGAMEVTLLDENGLSFSQKGKLIFSGELVDEATGMVNLRAIFPNPNGDLLPGMFVRARLNEGERPNTVVLDQRCVMRDPKGQAYVYVVTAENKIEQRNVVANRTFGTNWIIENGLVADERVVVEGLQKVKPGATVRVAGDSAQEAQKPAAQ